MQIQHRSDEPIGQLIIIGGAEDKFNERHILRRFLAMAGGSDASVLIIPVASEFPEIAAHVYTKTFQTLGARKVDTLEIATRGDALAVDPEDQLEGITGVFISGGDQARLSALLGGTPFAASLHDRVRGGLLLGGTSAGAAAMSASMIIRGQSAQGPHPASIRLAAGLGILDNVIIDQHFTQRHRLNRLITAVSYNPVNLGIGIDEDTAIVVSNGILEVIGTGTVTLVDGSQVTYSDIAEVAPSKPFAVCDLRVHVLNNKLRYDINNRKPLESLSDFA